MQQVLLHPEIGDSPLITPQPSPTAEKPSVSPEEQFIQTKSPTYLSKIKPPPSEAIAPAGSILQILSIEPIAKSTNYDSWVFQPSQ